MKNRELANFENHKPQISASGDPYGNRTRVSAVNTIFPMISKASPYFCGEKVSWDFKGLRADREISEASRIGRAIVPAYPQGRAA